MKSNSPLIEVIPKGEVVKPQVKLVSQLIEVLKQAKEEPDGSSSDTDGVGGHARAARKRASNTMQGR